MNNTNDVRIWLTIDSIELLADLKKSNENRISIETTLNEYRIQFNVLCTRTGGEAYKDISKQLAQLYILLRDGVNQLKLPIQWFLQILTKNLPRRVEITKNTDLSNYNSDMINKVQARETYLRCFQSIYSYLSSAMCKDQLEYVLILFALLTQDKLEGIQLFQTIMTKFNPVNQQVIPDFLNDEKRPSFVDRHAWVVCVSDVINRKYPNLSEHLVDHQQEWKEYLFSMTKLDFMNKSPFEQTTTMNTIDRFLLSIILLPNEIPDLIHTFFIYHYGGQLRDESVCSINSR
ncbi:unnamed protein product [Adineta ricciae]|uniref:Uncharacterized protein n=1 Tax=Adineta ricciae TaxID=249248 RepID=A0A814PMR5_ADIRI|nr:unnamed protein product [Adineta ricciae]CAF1613881.1 unnamed protein product [Adineta ricciae]